MAKKVLHVLQSDIYSGAENVVITMINNMNEEFECAYTSKDGSIRKMLEKNNIKFYAMKKISVKEVKRVIRQYKPDIIHAHDFKASTICSLLTKKIPVISHLHNNSPWIKTYHPFSFIFLFSCIKHKKILSVSSSVFNEYVFGKFIEKKSVVVPNPIDISRVKKEAQIYENDFVPTYDIAFLGRLETPKNPMRFINIVSELVKSNSNLKFVMIGDGSLREECQAKINKLGLNNNITLMGFIENPFKILSKVKALCMTSEWEGFGLAAVEAMSLGVPVVATPVGGLPSIINGICGKICYTDSEFVSELKSLLTDKLYRENKSNGATQRVLGLNNIDEYIKKIEMIYREIDGGPQKTIGYAKYVK